MHGQVAIEIERLKLVELAQDVLMQSDNWNVFKQSLGENDPLGDVSGHILTTKDECIDYLDSRINGLSHFSELSLQITCSRIGNKECYGCEDVKITFSVADNHYVITDASAMAEKVYKASIEQVPEVLEQCFPVTEGFESWAVAAY
ncbi:hypothetical protein [Vibrio sp. R78045]|uniref:hypothetical protein n=1 Tax=Vibrio sp. R78045 TaxID=3093868 RepID=UPI0036F2733B